MFFSSPSADIIEEFTLSSMSLKSENYCLAFSDMIESLTLSSDMSLKSEKSCLAFCEMIESFALSSEISLKSDKLLAYCFIPS